MRNYEILVSEEQEIDIHKLITETCDILNQFMQNLSDTWNKVKEYLRILDKQEDTARQEQGQEQGKEAVASKYIVKWREKYRPP